MLLTSWWLLSWMQRLPSDKRLPRVIVASQTSDTEGIPQEAALMQEGKKDPLVNLSMTIVMSCVFQSSLSIFISFPSFCSYLFWCLPLEFSSIRSTGADLRGHTIVINVCLSIFGSPKMQMPNIMGHTGSSMGNPTHLKCGICKGAKLWTDCHYDVHMFNIILNNWLTQEQGIFNPLSSRELSIYLKQRQRIKNLSWRIRPANYSHTLYYYFSVNQWRAILLNFLF